MAIKWDKYFDQIYSLTCTKNKESIDNLKTELDRIGILGSGIYYNYINTNTPLYRVVYDNIKKNFDYLCYNRGFFMTYGHYYCLRQAYELGYNKIAIMEDDIRFLKDIDKIEGIIERTNNIEFDYDILCCQIEYLDTKDYIDTTNEEFLSDTIKPVSHRKVGGAGFNIYSRSGIEKMVKLFEEEYVVIDTYEYFMDHGLSIYESYPWICIQRRHTYELNNDFVSNYNAIKMTDHELFKEFIKSISPVGILDENDTDMPYAVIMYTPYGGLDKLVKKILDKIENKHSFEYAVIEAYYKNYTDNKEAISMITKVEENFVVSIDNRYDYEYVKNTIIKNCIHIY